MYKMAAKSLFINKNLFNTEFKYNVLNSVLKKYFMFLNIFTIFLNFYLCRNKYYSYICYDAF